MTAHPWDLEEFVRGNLAADRRDAVAAHVKTCGRCLREHDALLAEDLLFAQRRQGFTAEPLAFAPVARELSRRSENHHGRARLWGAALAVAAAFLVARLPAPPVALGDSGGMCGASWRAVEWCDGDGLPGSDDGTERTEEMFRACLMASPG